jgi:predicted acetyltransferase
MLTEIPNDLRSGPIHLKFERIVEGDFLRRLVPYYHFKMLDKSGTIVGHINLRIGDTSHIKMCAGHVGFEVLPRFRGHSYSYHACQALAPFIRKHYEKILLTVNPDNIPSQRIFEKLKASFIDEIEVPADDPGYLNGARRKLRYEWVL